VGDPDRHYVDETVRSERLIEHDIPAEVRHSERIAVVRDALDDPAHDVARRDSRGRIAETQRVEHTHHFGAHASDVPHDATHSGRGAFDRQNLARMVVALVGEHERQVVAGRGQRNDACIFAGTDQHLTRASWETTQEVAGAL
jgi:hypothetical protein